MSSRYITTNPRGVRENSFKSNNPFTVLEAEEKEEKVEKKPVQRKSKPVQRKSEPVRIVEPKQPLPGKPIVIPPSSAWSKPLIWLKPQEVPVVPHSGVYQFKSLQDLLDWDSDFDLDGPDWDDFESIRHAVW